MNRKFTFLYAALIGLFFIYAFTAQPPINPGGNTGAPTDGNCTDCHNFNNNFDGVVDIVGLPGTITPGATYSLTVTTMVTAGTPSTAGFQTVALDGSNANAGTFSNLGASTGTQTHSSGRVYLGHQPALNFNGGNVLTWTADWTAPNGPAGETITFYTNAILGNNIGSAEDNMIHGEVTAVIAGSGALVATISSTTDVSCFGGNNGTAMVTASGGSGNYQYEWSTGMMNASATNLAAGMYMVTVTDLDDGMSATATATINQPATAVDLTIAETQNITCDNPTGSATAGATGGTGTIDFSWSNGMTGPTVTLGAGLFGVTATDENGCIDTATGSIVQNDTPPIAEAGPNQELTCTTSSVTLQGSGSMGAAISYNWTTQNGNFVNGQNTLNPVVDAVGIYTLTVTNNDTGCSSSDMVEVTENVTQPTLSVNISGVLNCQNTTVTINSTSTAPNSSYLWTGPNNFMSNIANPVVSVAGVYELTVTDNSNGCTNTIQALVMETTAPTATISNQINVLCNGDENGSATVMASGGAGSFTYEWSSGGMMATESGLGAGTYTVTVTDADDCTATISVTITEPDLLVANASATGETSTGGNDGTATADPMGGEPTYSYNWSNNMTTQTISGLAPGNYTVTVTDANMCTATQTVTVSNFDCGDVTLDFQINNVNCNGGNNGSLTALVNSNATPISYEWNNGVMEATNSGLTAGTYSVTIIDDNGCELTNSATITEPPAITINVSATDVSCNGANDGTATAMATGGTGVLTYFWDNGMTTPTIESLPPGTYTINVSDENFCSNSAMITVSQPPALILNVVTTNESANAANDGTALAEISGGAGNYTFLWSNGATTQMLENLEPDNYCVTVTDENGCTVEGCGFVDMFGCTSVQTVINHENVSCFGGTDGLATVESFNGTAPYNYIWSNGATSETIMNLTAGVYMVTCTDATACTGVSAITITEPNVLTLNVIDSGDVACDADDGFASVAAAGGILGYQYLWSTGDTTSMVTGLPAGNYTVTVTDPNDCTAETAVEIEEIPDTEPPMVAVNNIDVFLDENGQASITVDMINAGSTDNCGIDNIVIDVMDFDCEDMGSNEVVMAVLDVSGLCAFQTAFVMVIDSTPPVLICPPNIVMEGCNLEIEYAMPTATDNCEVGTPFFLEGLPSGGVFPAGTTTVKWGVNDGFGNPGTCEFLVTLENDFVGMGASTEASCAGLGDGTATVEPVNGIAPFTYAWNDDDMQTTPTAVGLSAGEYIATITDATGCPTVTTVEVSEPDLITIDVVEIIPETNDAMDGAITIETSGGSGMGFDYQWFLDGDLFSTDQNLTDLDAGTYVVFVVDMTDCTNSDTIIVDMAVGLFENSLTENINLYPNPTTGEFQIDIQLAAEKDVSVSIFDVTGKMVFTKQEMPVLKENLNIDLTNVANGVYLVKVQVGEEVWMQRIVVR